MSAVYVKGKIVHYTYDVDKYGITMIIGSGELNNINEGPYTIHASNRYYGDVYTFSAVFPTHSVDINDKEEYLTEEDKEDIIMVMKELMDETEDVTSVNLEIRGKVDEEELCYKRLVHVKPVPHYYGVGEKASIEYTCPVCDAFNNRHSIHEGEKNCSLCGINLKWDFYKDDEIIEEKVEKPVTEEHTEKKPQKTVMQAYFDVEDWLHSEEGKKRPLEIQSAILWGALKMARSQGAIDWDDMRRLYGEFISHRMNLR